MKSKSPPVYLALDKKMVISKIFKLVLVLRLVDFFQLTRDLMLHVYMLHVTCTGRTGTVGSVVSVVITTNGQP